jgi:hypothetical protein
MTDIGTDPRALTEFPYLSSLKLPMIGGISNACHTLRVKRENPRPTTRRSRLTCVISKPGLGLEHKSRHHTRSIVKHVYPAR